MCWLATVDAKGAPSVSPKEFFHLAPGRQVMIADIASAGSVRNIRENSAVCASFIDVFRQTGFKIRGQARLVAPEAPEFASVGAALIDRAAGAFPIRHIIVVGQTRITPIVAPSYRLYPDRSDEARLAETYATYGVRPVDTS